MDLSSPKKKCLMITAMVGFVVIVISIGIGLHLAYKYKDKQLDTNDKDERKSSNNEIGSTVQQSTIATDTEGPDLETCISDGCAKGAAMLANNTERMINPCENFYRFACGGWIKKKKTLNANISYSIINDQIIQQQHALQMLLKEHLPDVDKKFVKKLKDVYYACLYKKSNDEPGYVFLRKEIENVWPQSNRIWNKNNFDYTDIIIKMHQLGLKQNFFINLKVAPVLTKSTEFEIQLHLPKIVKDMGNSKKAFERMKDIKQKIGLKIFDDNMDFNIMLGIEMDLKQVLDSNVNKAKISRSIKDLNRMLPQINWTKLCCKLIDPNINENEPLRLFFNEDQISALKKFFETDKRHMITYMVWNLLEDVINTMENTECLDYLYENMDMALASAYVKKVLSMKDHTMATKITSYVRQNVISQLKNVKWLLPSVRDLAIKKVNKTMVSFPYNKELKDDKFLENFYANLKISNESFFLNHMEIQKFRFNLEASLLRTKNYKGNWTTQIVINPSTSFHRLESNRIDISVTKATEPFFMEDRPNYMNFGGIGSIIGQLLIRGIFPPEGSEYDSDGNVMPWWDNESRDRYMNITNCFKYQNSSFTRAAISGKKSLDEGINDNAGFKAAYNAYLSWKTTNTGELPLPKLKLTPNKIFWITLANVWCSYHGKDNDNNPDEFRINQAISNLGEFSKDFVCPTGSPMNPGKKCGPFN